MAEAVKDGSLRYITMVYKDIIAGKATASVGSILEGIETLKKHRMGFPEDIYNYLPGAANPANQPKVVADVERDLTEFTDNAYNRNISVTLTKIANGEEKAKKGTIKRAVEVLKKNHVTVPDLKGMLDGTEGDNDFITGETAPAMSKEDQIADLNKKIEKYQDELATAKSHLARDSKAASMAVAVKSHLAKIEKLEKNIKECRDKIRWAGGN